VTWSATAADGNCGDEAEVLLAGESLPSTRGAARPEVLQATDTSDCRQVKNVNFEIYIADRKATTCI